MSKSIMVCNECNQPLLWTFAFPYCEYYCLSCGARGGMFGTGHEVDLTPELKAKRSAINRKWGQVSKWIVAGKFYRRDCKKCDPEYHYQHLTDAEKTKHTWAMQKLTDWSLES